ncbi:MAG: hypothetical protein ABI415_02130 [Flavitalea sp.]
MKNGCKYITAFLLFVAAFINAQAQVNIKAGVDHDKILIGEPILISVEAYVPLGAEVNWFSLDTIPHFDIIRRSTPDTASDMDGKKITQLITVTSFDSGRWAIPAFEVSVAGKPYYSDSLTVDVAYEAFDSRQDYHDIKDIVAVANPYVKYVAWVIGIVALVALAGIIILLKRKKQNSTYVKKEESRASAYEDAMFAIGELRKKGVGAEGEKKYYSTLNDILRKYVSGNFGISTFERTNEELIIRLSSMGIQKEAFIKLSQSLRMSDFVKFAKYRPSEEDNINNLETVRKSINILNTCAISAV